MVNISNLKNLFVSNSAKLAYIDKAHEVMSSPIKSLPVKPDIFQMTPQVKASVKQQIKKFDNPTFTQKVCRFLSKNKVGKALMFGAMALIALVSGKKIADDIEEKVQ